MSGQEIDVMPFGRMRTFRGALVVLLFLLGATAIFAQPSGRFNRAQQHAQTGYKDLAGTWNAKQTHDTPLGFTENSTPTSERDIGFKSTTGQFGYFEEGGFHPFRLSLLMEGANPLRMESLNLIAGEGVALTRTNSPSGQMNVTINATSTAPLGTQPFFLTGTTTNATATVLTISSGTYDGMELDSSSGYTITLVGRGTSGGNSGKMMHAVYKVSAKNNAGISTLVGGPGGDEIANEVPWSADVQVNDTTEKIEVYVTGDVGTTVKWIARVEETSVAN